MPERSSRSNNNDRRVKRTKRALRDALLTLLKTKSVNQITVTELTALADVNRATFYFYYTDIVDMLLSVQAEAYNSFKEFALDSLTIIKDKFNLTEFLEKFLNFCLENESICKFVICSDTNSQVYKRIKKLLLSNILDSKYIYPENSPARYYTDYVMAAMTGAVAEWMNDGMIVPVHEFAEYLATFHTEGSNAIYLRYNQNKTE